MGALNLSKRHWALLIEDPVLWLPIDLKSRRRNEKVTQRNAACPRKQLLCSAIDEIRREDPRRTVRHTLERLRVDIQEEARESDTARMLVNSHVLERLFEAFVQALESACCNRRAICVWLTSP